MTKEEARNEAKPADSHPWAFVVLTVVYLAWIAVLLWMYFKTVRH